MNFPPPGTKCADCVHCEAAIYVDGTPICWHCDAGEPCPDVSKPAQPEKPQAVETTSKEVAPMPLKESKRPRLSDAVKAAILGADPNIPSYKLAKQLGISDFSVNKIRKQAGIKGTARLSPQQQRSDDIADKIRASVNAALREPLVNCRLVAEPAALETMDPSSQITITVHSEITEERAQAIFARFTPALKAIALQAGLRAAMEEA